MSATIHFVIIISTYLRLVQAQNVSYQNISTVFTDSSDDLLQKRNQDIVMSQSNFVAVYEGAVARMDCRLKNEENVSWTYAKSLSNLSFTTLPPNERVVIQIGSVSVYRATFDDAGVYRCQTDDDNRKLVILEVVNDGTYTVVNQPDTQVICNPIHTIGKELIVFYLWTHWSECSVCGKTGRRRRFGMCYVKLYNTTKSEENNHNNISRRITSILEEFPEGIPCRSWHLPSIIRNLPAVRNKPNVIKIASCKIQCKIEIFQQSSPTGVLLETANNTAGIYSLTQHLPPQPPAPARSIMFVGRGQRVLVKCTGTTLRDIPVSWQAGNLPVDSDILRESSAGRVYINTRDHIVISHVLYEDANLYSCWEGDNLAGTVKLEVWTGRQATWNHHTVLLIMLVCGAMAMRLAVKIA